MKAIFCLPDQEKIKKEFGEEILKLTGSNQKLISLALPKDDPKQRQPDITRAKQILGWEPKVSRKDGLKITYEYFKYVVTAVDFIFSKDYSFEFKAIIYLLLFLILAHQKYRVPA